MEAELYVLKKLLKDAANESTIGFTKEDLIADLIANLNEPSARTSITKLLTHLIKIGFVNLVGKKYYKWKSHKDIEDIKNEKKINDIKVAINLCQNYDMLIARIKILSDQYKAISDDQLRTINPYYAEEISSVKNEAEEAATEEEIKKKEEKIKKEAHDDYIDRHLNIDSFLSEFIFELSSVKNLKKVNDKDVKKSQQYEDEIDSVRNNCLNTLSFTGIGKNQILDYIRILQYAYYEDDIHEYEGKKLLKQLLDLMQSQSK